MRIQTTEEMKAGLFESDLYCRAFIDQLTGDEIELEPSEALFMRRFPQSDTLGTIYFPFHADETISLRLGQELLPAAAALFVPADELESKRKPALDWLRGVCTWDVSCAVVVYTLTDDESGFASLERLWPDWVPDQVGPGQTIRYEGIAHPFPGAKGICLNIYDEPFEIEEMILFEQEPWYSIRNVARTNETLWITEMLLIGSATFDCMPTRSFERYATPNGSPTAFDRDTKVVPR